MKNLVLRPNCLITKSQLIFVPGPRSLFFYKKMFGDLPEFLYEHGYRVDTVSLPFRQKALRQLIFKKWLKQKPKNEKFHFILDELTVNEFESVFTEFKESIQSLTVIKTNSTDQFKQNEFVIDVHSVESASINYYLHRFFSWIYRTEVSSYATSFSQFNEENYNRFLDHCVKLAENEIYA